MKAIRWHHALHVLLLAASALLVFWLLHGPIQSPFPMHSPVNVETAIALCSLLFLILRSRSSNLEPVLLQSEGRWATAVSLASLGAVTVLVFYPVLSAPLLHDSYTHVALALRASWNGIVHQFTTHPTAGDYFFRPVGDISYWLDVSWAGSHPFRWHLWNLVLHLVNVALVYQLASRLGFSQAGKLTAAFVFAVHGTRPETVAWAAARYDLLAAFFSLVTLTLVLRYARQAPAVQWLILSATTCGLALLSKEAAYTLPLLVLLLATLFPESKNRLSRSAAVLFAVTVVVFFYRFWLLGGLGGYGAQSGHPTILHFSVLRALKALVLREWALLFFPVNWSVPLTASQEVAFLIGIGALVWLITHVVVPRRLLLVTMAWVVLASLPVQHLLLLNQDLNGARVLYWPVLGFAFLWGSMATYASSRSAFISVAFMIVAQIVVLQHNLAVWRSVAYHAESVCRAFGEQLGSNPAPVSVLGLPAIENGVFFLKNGFPECVAANSGRSLSLPALPIRVDPPSPIPGRKTYHWNAETGRITQN